MEKGIQTRTELLAFANNQKVNGKFDIAEFIVNRGPRVVAEVLNTAWELRNAQEKLDRSKKSRIELLHEASQGDALWDAMDNGFFVHLKSSNKME